VDEGVVCDVGVAQWVGTFYADTGLPETGPPEDGTVLWVDYKFTCDDGSFVLRSEATVDNARLEAGLESGQPMNGGVFTAIHGTGAYEELTADGDRTMQFLPSGVRDVFTGDITSD
jgi:hypothetical protein